VRQHLTILRNRKIAARGRKENRKIKTRKGQIKREVDGPSH
jgi:hypothetical protein